MSNVNKSFGSFGGYEHRIFIKPVNLDLICAICSRK